MDYDVLILGGGVVGCSVAYELSKYNLNIALIEKDYDVADDISFVNTTVVYDGSETSDAEMARLENYGQSLIEQDCKKFNVPYKKVGALRIANTEDGIRQIEKMYTTSKERGIDKVFLIDSNDVYDIEPNINVSVKKALYSENVAIIAPYDLTIAYAEVAADNGVNFRFEEEVIKISNISKGFKVSTNKNKFTCKVVINTIPNEIYISGSEVTNIEELNEKISVKNMSYLVVDENIEGQMNKVVISNLDEHSFVLNTPNLSGGSIIGVKTATSLDINNAIEHANVLMPKISSSNISNVFKETYDRDSMLIDDTEIEKGYIRITGTHYGKITVAPAIAQKISDTLCKNMKVTLKKDFIDKRRECYKFRNMNMKERNDLIKLDSRYGNIICVCNQVSEGEIIDSIRRPLGARTVEGVKRRTGAGLGNCHGSYCVRKIINILAREMDKKPTEIVEDLKNSNVWISRIKEFDEV